MDSTLEKTRARARLLLASEKLCELLEFLENGVPALIDEVEQLRLELAEMKAQQKGYRPPSSSVLQRHVENSKEKQLLSSKEFAFALGVKESTVRRWTLLRKIKVVKVGHLVRIPHTEAVRIIDEGTIPARPSRI